MLRIILLASCLICLAACGGGGGGSGSTNGSGSGDLGSRAVPGGSVSVSKSDSAVAGHQTFRLTIQDFAPAQVRAWIGTEYDPDATGVAAEPVAGLPGIYDLTLAVPSPLPADAHVWVRLVHGDGSVIETGRDDFQLSR